jgi:hypothetical protein
LVHAGKFGSKQRGLVTANTGSNFDDNIFFIKWIAGAGQFGEFAFEAFFFDSAARPVQSQRGRAFLHPAHC